MTIRLALYQPDIAQNVGAAMRLCACLNTPLDIIEPCGFPWNQDKIRRVGMDYIQHVDLSRHDGWQTFTQAHSDRRLVLMTTKTDRACWDFTFEPGDILIAGQESAGVPIDIHESLTHKVTIPMAGETRSLNIINASAIILGEALRQTR